MVHKVGSWMAMGQFEISPFIGELPLVLSIELTKDMLTQVTHQKICSIK